MGRKNNGWTGAGGQRCELCGVVIKGSSMFCSNTCRDNHKKLDDILSVPGPMEKAKIKALARKAKNA